MGTVVDLRIVPLAQGCGWRGGRDGSREVSGLGFRDGSREVSAEEGIRNLIGCCCGRTSRPCNAPNPVNPRRKHHTLKPANP